MASEVLQQGEDIKVWQVVNGKITQMMIQNGLFVVRDDATLDPVKVARDFISVFDTGKTAVLRKVVGNVKLPTQSSNRPIVEEKKHKRTRMIEEGTIVGKVNNIPITKERVVAFFKKYPRTYTLDQMKGVWSAEYEPKCLAEFSIFNKQRAYQKYLESKGYVKQVAGHGNYGKKFEWKEAPFGAVPPEKVEVDSKYLMDIRNKEREAFRDR